MFKAIFFIKRKTDLSHDQFRAHFENVHVKMAQKYFGRMMLGYQRHYPTQIIIGARVGSAEVFGDFDCISEWLLPDRATFDRIMTEMGDTPIGQEFREDEKRFLDVEATLLVLVDRDDLVDTGPRGAGRA